jgi:hypothetical protein
MVETPIFHPRKQRQAQPPVEECFDTLGEAHDENVYSAIERLVQAGEQVGFTVDDLIRMLKGGITLESLFDVIEVRMVGSCVHRIQGHIHNY